MGMSAMGSTVMFVELPGIITTNSVDGKDNREGIKKIIREEMQARNTKLLILLEPKEYSTNSVIDYVGETLGDRAKWLDKSIFFDDQV